MKALIKILYSLLLVAVALLALNQLSSRSDLLGQEPLAQCCNNSVCDNGTDCGVACTIKSEVLWGCNYPYEPTYDCKKCIDLQRQNKACGHFNRDAYCNNNGTPYYVCPQVSVSISGPSQLQPNQTGTFTANVSGGTSPFSYQWYKRIECDYSLAGPSGKPSPRAPPCGEWFAGGTNSPTYQTAAWSDFSVRVDISDYCHQGEEPRTASAQHYVTVSGGLAKSETSAPSMSVAGEATSGKSLSSSAKASGFEMSAYPNPFNPTTIIGFTISQPAPVSLAVYNIRGQQVRGLISGEGLSAGTHTVVWDGKNNSGGDVASGLYLCQLSTGDGVKVIRLLLTR